MKALTGLAFCEFDISYAFSTGLYGQGLLYGGPAVLFWGWILTGFLTRLVGLAMSELLSKFPVSGGLYFWSFMLAEEYGCHGGGRLVTVLYTFTTVNNPCRQTVY